LQFALPLGAACAREPVAGVARDVIMPVVSLPPSVEPEFCVVARRNDSLGTRGRCMAFCLVAAVSLMLGIAFVLAGAWLVLPWSLLEISVLAGAFVCLERRARDWERLTVQGDRVIVERMQGGRVHRREWNRHWLRVETSAGLDGQPARILLRSAGDACEFGAELPAEARGTVARDLRRLTGL
jgi:uncharacterized membrane protein